MERGQSPREEQELIDILAPTTGEERARELVRGAIASLGIASEPLTLPNAIRVLEFLSQTSGVVGAVTRFAQARLRLREANLTPPTRSISRQMARVSANSELHRPELTALLASSLGEEKSDEVVLESLRALHFPEDRFTLEQALGVLERLAASEDLVGVAARFAKAHLLMRAKGMT
jgi:hypothetical protein